MNFTQISLSLLAGLVSASLLAGLVLGAVVGWKASTKRRSQLESQLADLQQSLHKDAQQFDQTRQEYYAAREKIASLTSKLEGANQAMDQRERLLRESQQLLKSEFSRLASQMLEEKNRKLDQQNQQLLGPLREQLKHFRERVDQIHTFDTQQQASLRAELHSLRQLNQQITTEAHNLSKALQGKGTSQAQGAWGEMILERLLEESGLTKGREYLVQHTVHGEAHNRLRPDIIVRLPDNKDVVIDSKVSLNAYTRYHASQSDDERSHALDELVQAIRAHIRELGGRDYSQAEEVRSLDLVLMFIPVEGAYVLALAKCPALFTEAFAQRIALIGPSTLPSTLKIIHYLWRTDQQNRNAEEIAKRAAGLYDKLRLVIEDVEKLDTQIQRSMSTLGDVKNKLSQGRGNLVGRVESFRRLGVGVKKPISKAIQTEEADQDELPRLEAAAEQPRDTAGQGDRVDDTPRHTTHPNDQKTAHSADQPLPEEHN